MRAQLTGISLGLLALSGGAMAQDAGSMFSFSGFGTLAVVKTSTDDATYVTNFQKHGATKSASAEPDSKLGGQVNAKLNDTFSGTLQLLAKQDAVGEYGPKVEWAFLKAKVNGNFDVRAGRIGAPVFMTSDYRNVGYTNLSMRTPPDVYRAVPVSSFDGADLLYQHSVGNTTFNAQFYVGKSSTKTNDTTTFLLNDMKGINLTAENGAFTYRAGYTQTVLGAEGTGVSGLATLQGGLRSLGAVPGLGSLTTLADNIGIDGKKASFAGVGIAYDSGNWVGSAELTKRKSDSLYVSDLSGWYTTLGYRVGKVTPYVSLSGNNTDSLTSFTAPSTVGYPAPVQVGVATAVANVNGGVLNNYTEKTLAFGARWDAGKGYAIKGEIARVSIPADSTGWFTGATRSATDTNVNVLSVGVDFVF
jgi:hypothetical protein